MDGVRRRAEARQGRHRRHPRRPQAPPGRSSPCCVRSATTRRTPPASSTRFVAHFDFLEGQWEKERDVAADPGRGAGRDLQAGPPGRAADGRVGPRLLPQRASSRTVATTCRASVATSSTASSAPRSPSSISCSARTSSSAASTAPTPTPTRPSSPAGLGPADVLRRGRGPRRDHATCSTSSSRSRATASTTRTTSPTAASAASAS